ncbi:MAG: hypothetical protein GY736_25010 [Sphingomonas sp.]|nr:hypothetical protein [Sphingomonas sp.]
MGHDAATSFFSTEARPRFRQPADLIEPTLGALAVPNNFAGEDEGEGTIRLTTLARHDRWAALDDDEYVAAKEQCADEAIAAATAFFPDWRPHTVFRDVFTPTTIHRFTGRLGGAIYGSAEKRLGGETGVRGLLLCGADQGFVGVVGALYSGILMANRHAATATT